MAYTAPSAIPTILFGAFDRHNFGDLLFPHIVTAALNIKNPVYVGLAARDLRAYGGYRTKALAQLAAGWAEYPVHIIHAGGELLTCGAWEAAVMLLPPERAHDAVARLEADVLGRLDWAHKQLGIPALAPYTLPRRLFPRAATVAYHAVGGVEFDACSPAMRAEVLGNLKAADVVSVRDKHTQSRLTAAGVVVPLAPDPAVMVAELFGTVIEKHAQTGEVAQMRAAFPRGYITVQFSADFDDGVTLSQIADQLDQIATASGCGVVLFRAGAAPWHDDLMCLRRTASYMHTPVKIFLSLDIWDICAVIAKGCAYAGSSLHGRIVAMAFALPRVNLCHPILGSAYSKQAAFAATWESVDMPATVHASGIVQGLQKAMATDAQQRKHTASELVAQYRQSARVLMQGLGSDYL